MTSGREHGSAYRDELVAAQTRIAELEARILAHDDGGDDAPRFAELHRTRADLVEQGRRFASLGPNGLAALVVMVLVLGSVMVITGRTGGAPLFVVASVVLVLLMSMMVAVLRIGHRANTKDRLAIVDQKIDDLVRQIATARAERRRVRVTPEAEPDEDVLSEDMEPAVQLKRDRPT